MRTLSRRPGLPLLPALLILAAALLQPRPLHAQVPGYEEGIVEVGVERLAPLTVLVLVDSAGAVLLPLREVAAHLGLTLDRRGDVIAVPATSGGSNQLDLAAQTMRVSDVAHSLTPAEIVVLGDEIYLRLEPLGRLIEAQVQFNPTRLSVAFRRTTPFPAQQRVLAEQRRAVLLAIQRQNEQLSMRDTVRYAPVTGAGVLDWELSTIGNDPLRLTTLRTQAGVALLGGDLNGGATWEAGRDAEGVRDVSLRYHRVFPRARELTQVAAGDILTTGLYARFIEGIELSNKPVQRSYDLGAVLVRPDLPPGWDYEVFQGARLLGFSEAGADDAVSIPLNTGTTPVEVRMYGPAGQEVTSTLLYQTPVSILARRALEYVAGAGRCAAGSCERYAHADVRYGATSLITVGGGLELMEDSTHDALRPYLVSSFSTGTLLTGEVTLMPGAQYAASLAAFPRAGSTAQLRFNVARPGFTGPSLVGDGVSRWDAELSWDERAHVPLRAFGQMRFGASAIGSGDAIQYWRVTAAGGFNRGYVEARYDHDRTARHPHTISARAAVLTPLRMRGREYRPMLNSTLGVGDVGVRLLDLSASISPDTRSVVTAGVLWTRERDASFTVSYTARIGALRAVARVVAGNGTGSSALSVGSSAVLSDERLELQPGPRLGYAGISGRVFVDRDGDGVFSSGDDVVPNARLVVGTLHVEADDAGRYRLWGLQPYVAIGVAVDSTRTPDPSWTTALPELLVRPVPNTARPFDVPLIQTRELIGSITADPDVASTGGLTLLITNTATGDSISAITFSDGQFYVSRIRPGSYRLTVAPSSLAALDADSSPTALEFTVPPAADDIVLELSPLHLRRRQSP